MEISNFTKYFVYWKISLVMLLENIITSDVIGKYIMGRLTNIGKYSSWSLILEASLHKIYCILSSLTCLRGEEHSDQQVGGFFFDSSSSEVEPGNS